MVCVYLGLGSNLGRREIHILRGVQALQTVAQLVAVSSLFETEPWGILCQPRFLNGAAAIETDLAPQTLLQLLKEIERREGRSPMPRNGPRPLDLDLLLYGQMRIETAELTVPHRGMLERATVLVPLAEIAPDVRHPVTGRTISEHLRELGKRTGIARYPPGLGGGKG